MEPARKPAPPRGTAASQAQAQTNQAVSRRVGELAGVLVQLTVLEDQNLEIMSNMLPQGRTATASVSSWGTVERRSVSGMMLYTGV